jgi:ABC-type microcin C transport system permease subunit YejB
MLLIVAGFPAGVHRYPVHVRAAGGDRVFARWLGLLGFQAAIQRDYPVMFGTLYIFTVGPGDADRWRHDVHRGRSAHRFRGRH